NVLPHAVVVILRAIGFVFGCPGNFRAEDEGSDARVFVCRRQIRCEGLQTQRGDSDGHQCHFHQGVAGGSALSVMEPLSKPGAEAVKMISPEGALALTNAMHLPWNAWRLSAWNGSWLVLSA